MLITKDVKVIKSKDKKSYTAYPFDKFNLQFASTDKVENFTATTDGKETKLPDGSVFTGTYVNSTVTADVSNDAVAMLYMEAESYCEGLATVISFNKAGEPQPNSYVKDGAPIANAGKLYLLALASTAADLQIRSALDAQYRSVESDPAEVLTKQVNQYIAAKAKEGKTVSAEKARAIVVKINAARAALEAEMLAEEETAA